MNYGNAKIIQQMQTSMLRFKSTMTDILVSYRNATAKETSAAEHYDEEYRAKFLSEQKKALDINARQRIEDARKLLSDELKEQLSALRKELVAHLQLTPNEYLVKNLSIYRDFNIKPTRIELESMLTQAEGNSLATQAINSLLQQTKSIYRIKATDPLDFEADLAELEHFADDTLGMLFRPDELHHEAAAIFDGQKRDAIGNTWSGVGIITASMGFSGIEKMLDEMIPRWTDGVTPSVEQKGDYSTDEAFDSDRRATGSGASVETDPEAAAMLHAAKVVEDQRSYDSVMRHYV